jgi:hypothetical protein
MSLLLFFFKQQVVVLYSSTECMQLLLCIAVQPALTEV